MPRDRATGWRRCGQRALFASAMSAAAQTSSSALRTISVCVSSACSRFASSAVSASGTSVVALFSTASEKMQKMSARDAAALRSRIRSTEPIHARRAAEVRARSA